MFKFTSASLPDLTGFIAIVTGGHSGLLVFSLPAPRMLSAKHEFANINVEA